MPDFIDKVSEREAEILADALAAQARRAGHGPTATGACLLCEEPLPDGRRWCDPFCRDRWEAEREAAARNIKPEDEG